MLAWGQRGHVGGEHRKRVVSDVDESAHTLSLMATCLHFLRSCRSSIFEVSYPNNPKEMLLFEMEGTPGTGRESAR